MSVSLAPSAIEIPAAGFTTPRPAGLEQLSRGPAGRTVLLVEPSYGSRTRLAAEFGRLGFTVWGAENLDDATVILRTEYPAVVVSELRLSQKSVFDLIPIVDNFCPGTSVVVATAFASVASAIRAVRAGVKHYVAQPVAASQILAALDSVEVGDAPEEGPPPLSLDRAMWEYINFVFDQAGSVSEAARRLGLDRRSLRRMLARNAPSTAPPELASAPIDRNQTNRRNHGESGQIR